MALREQIGFLQIEKVRYLKLDLEQSSLFLQNHVRPGKIKLCKLIVREWGIRANLRPPPGVLRCLAARRSRVLSICCVSKKVETPRQPVFCQLDDEKEMPKKRGSGGSFRFVPLLDF